jgi:hypothetical protein
MNALQTDWTKPSLERIYQLEDAMRAFPTVESPVISTFAPGVYMRSILLMANTAHVGRMHKTEHLMIMSTGDLDIMTESGMVRMTGFNIIKSMPGIKRAVRVYADTILTTIHVTDETDIDKIKEAILVDEPLIGIEGGSP